MKIGKIFMVIAVILGVLILAWAVNKFIDYRQAKQGAVTDAITQEFTDPIAQEVLQHLYKKEYDSAREKIKQNPQVLDIVSPEDYTILTYTLKHVDDKKILSLLLDAGANLNIPIDRAPLAMAASISDFETSKMLLEAGADPNSKSSGQSALWLAANNSRFDLVELLLARGADVNALDTDNFSPAQAAARINRFTMVNYLLKHDANPFTPSSHGFTIGYWVIESRLPSPPTQNVEANARLETIEILKGMGHPWPPPGPDKVLELQKKGEWPPKNAK